MSSWDCFVVRLTGIEPALREELDPKSSASANSATGANAGAKLVFFFVMTIKKGKILVFVGLITVLIFVLIMLISV